ncbi:THO complex subunit 2 [Lobosporangium transversale]|uniref:THO complex subunit 2 n=1 Tax=Lobosporangium transversale TaxID=64571 RepID=A0A1Y2GYM6_9FUNG|nr:transcription factor/nuclear export subunit protein 2-domain-containing protein [Lobosporangium transversale]KAF9905378.1 THO complex subunit 2 [Lobosporangium transversale]ORZ26871.1 transcription factor/nuclear export subunit protein 2-domain-containing protein [Lobosporangium transversale]|eukprot:XP_021884618.1 transcription factor/nuclear export subunit protein 2-domain-containing protein [Lobosporangium transversale]
MSLKDLYPVVEMGHLARWKETGSYEDLMCYSAELLSTPNDAIPHPIATVIQLVLAEAVADTLPVDNAAAFLRQLATKPSESSSGDVASIIVDFIWFKEAELDNYTDNPEVQAKKPERFVRVAKALIAQNFIPERLMKERWELSFLEKTGVISNIEDSKKRVIRASTNQLYKQHKFNLLREESEGYSKLITELASGTADNDNVGKVASKAQSVFANVLILIGYFDLDPIRVLSIVLDVFSANIITHYHFFIEFLLISPWSSQTMGNLPAFKNKACAQVLGFMFQDSQRPENRYKSLVELYTVSALLIKHSIISLDDLYPHLSPTDNEIAQEYTRFVEAMKSKAQEYKSSPLAMAGALENDTVTSRDKGGKAVEEPVPEAIPGLPLPNQKVGVLNALLSLGDLDHAMFILARLPKLTASHPESADLVCRLINEMISPVYSPLSPSASHPQLAKRKDFAYRYPTASEGKEVKAVRILDPWLPLPTETERYEYFYQEWGDDLVLCQTVQDIVHYVYPVLSVVGARIHRDLKLVTKLCRIGAGTLDRIRREVAMLDGQDDARLAMLNSEKEIIEGIWVDMTRSLFLPTVSLAFSNPGIVHEVWQVIKGLNYQTRFALYGEWKSEAAKQYPELLVTTASAEKDAKDMMRRINKENVKEYGRMFAKYAHSNPLVVFAAAIKQLEGGYDNMAQPLVDACKYLTDFGHDVLSYSLLESLSKQTRSKAQEDGTSIAKWMNTLALFCGKLYRKYPSGELMGILQYVVNQLRQRNTYDLVVLRELLSKMGGVEDLSNLTREQLLAMAGGELLRDEVLAASVTGAVIKKDVRSCSRLQKTMAHDNIAAQLVVLLAQHRQECIFGSVEIPHLKVLSNIFDQAHSTLLQFLDFLSSRHQEGYTILLPSLTDLCETYKITPAVAMYIVRPKLQELIHLEQTTEIVVQPGSNPAPDSGDVDVIEAGENKSNETTIANKEPWLPCLRSVALEVKSTLPPKAWRSMKPHFYITFWQLTMYDIYVPVREYYSEINRLKQSIRAMDNDKATYNSSMQAKNNRDRDRLVNRAFNLQLEMERHLAHHKTVMERLKREKNHWFKGLDASREEIIGQVIQHCIYPRAVMSGMDAIFCSAFIQLMHSLGTINFSTLTLFDKLFLEVDRILFLSSESEAKSYGLFLSSVLSNLARWHKSSALYAAEGHGDNLPGFQVKWGSHNINDVIHEEDLLDFEMFRHGLFKWHVRLFQAFQSAVETKEYMPMKNTIMMLRELAPRYPELMVLGTRLTSTFKSIAESEERADLKLMAASYLGVLKKGQSSGAWLPTCQFHLVQPKERTGAQPRTSEPSAAGMPKAGPSKQPLAKASTAAVERRNRNTNVDGSKGSLAPSAERASRTGGDALSSSERRTAVPLPPRPAGPRHGGSASLASSRDGPRGGPGRLQSDPRDSRDQRETRGRYDPRGWREPRDRHDPRGRREADPRGSSRRQDPTRGSESYRPSRDRLDRKHGRDTSLERDRDPKRRR